MRCYRRLIFRVFALAASVLIAVSAHGVDARTSLAVFGEVRTWVDSWAIPEGAQVWLGDDAVGVCVTLRYGGVVMGRGVRMRGDDESLHDAVRDAMNEAVYTLPVRHDATEHEQLVALSADIAVDVQIATGLTPLFGKSVTEATRECSPGRHGVAARVGNEIAAVFGGSMLASNRTPAESLRSVLSSMGLPLDSLEELRQSRGVIVYRFDATQLAQPAAGEPAVFLHRGGRVRTLRDVNVRGLREMGDGLASHILRRRSGEDEQGLLGVYEPWTGRYGKGELAGAHAQAMSALALARWAQVRTKQGLPDAGLREAAMWVLEGIASGDENMQLSAAASAMYVVAAREVSWDIDELPEAVRAMRARCLAHVRTLFDEESGFADGLGDSQRAMVSLALVETTVGAKAVRRLFRETPPTQLPTVMPWLGWAELALVADDARVPAGVALRSMRELMWRHQLRATMLPPTDRDLEGGIVFTSSSNPLPTAQLLRPVALLATMLGDARLTSDDELPGELTSLMRSMRFVQQLCAGRAEGHMFAESQASVWGVRNALWDQRMRLESSAMALLTASEMLDSVFARTARGTGANNGADK